MKIYKILSAILAVCLFTGCSETDEPVSTPASALAFEITDGGFEGETRAAENGYSTEFTAGDRCGLYIVRNGQAVYGNICLIAAEADGSISWKPEILISEVFADDSYFLYYPYQENMVGLANVSASDAAGFFEQLAKTWNTTKDQSTYAAYTASDLMTAKGEVAANSGEMLSISFSMTHRMALAVIDAPKTVYKFTDTSIPDYTATTAVDFTRSDTKPCRMADDTYRFIHSPEGTAPKITGKLSGSSNGFSFTPSGIASGSYKTYKIDGAPQTEKQATLQMGDYFCKGSDDKWYIIPQEATPDGNVIGIVFHAGQHSSDGADYSATGIGQEKCHGYAVALTDVHNDDNDRLCWEYGPNNEYNQTVGTYTDTDDWQGYSNYLKFHEFVNKNDNKAASWEIQHFPAALACETYGNRTLDNSGNPTDNAYDWQQPLAAPDNTSGWFLPSCGQLRYLYQNSSDLSARMDVVKNSTPNDFSYKGYIKWFEANYYWSSTENPYTTRYARLVCFSNGNMDNYDKYFSDFVRAVLAF